MALTFKDRVLETSVSIGTGDFICGGAQTGYQPFSTVGDGATVTYTIQGKNLDGTLTGDWEVGVGTYHLTGNYISRDTVLESSNGNAKVYFPAGDKDIFLDLPGERIVQSPTIAVNGNFVSYDGVTGQIIKDSGSKASDFATAAQGAKADTAVQQSVVGQPNGVASLDSTGKVPTSQIPQMGDLNYQGTWNASTNTPTLTSGVGTKGYYYVVNVAGTTNLDGITDWFVGDWAVFNGTVWEQIDNTDAVTSVNGYTGAVTLTYTDVGAQPAGTYVTSVSGTAPVVSSGGTTPAISMHVADATNDGYLSSTDWNTFNGKVSMVYPGAGIPNSTGTAWGTSYSTTGTGTVVALGTNPTLYNPNIDVIDFDTTYATTLTAGQLGWDGNNTLGLGMAGGNVIQHIGEDQFFYCKATSSITKGQVVMFTGAVGASGVPTGAPATGITDGTYIMGIAAEAIATNGFGLVQSFGTLRNVNTSGYADGDILWYNPAVAGGMTNTKPSAPNVKVQMAAVINGGSSGGGTILIRINPGSTLGGTDSNAQINGASNGQILTYDGAGTYWKNTSLTAGTAISVSTSATGVLTITNSAPDQTVTLTAGTGISVTGTYPSFTVTNTAPDQVVSITGAGGAVVTGTYPNFTVTTPSGTVTSVTATAPLASSGGATPNLTITQASGSTNGYLSSTDWNTFNNKVSSQWTTNGSNIYYNTGSVAIGTTVPQRALDIRGTTSAEQIIGVSSAAANGHYWNFLVDGGSGGGTKSSFTIRPLDDTFTDVPGIGFTINGATGIFATRANNAISPASVPTGSVIQTQWTNLGTGNFTTTAASAQNTGFSVSFTPKLSTSKVLHIVTIGAYYVCDGNLFIARNGTIVSPSLADSYRSVAITDYIYDMPPTTVTWLDSPGTTSAITYALYAYASGCARTCFIGSTGDFISSWTCMEIAA